MSASPSASTPRAGTAVAAPSAPSSGPSSPGAGRAGHAGQPGQGVRAVSVLLYSDDVATRDAVRVGVGRRPAKDLEVARWHECATAAAVVSAVDGGGFDLLVLDGEAVPMGGLGLCRQLTSEIPHCPPVVVLTGRPQDGWLAAWSGAAAAVPHPVDPLALGSAMAQAVRDAGRG